MKSRVAQLNHLPELLTATGIVWAGHRSVVYAVATIGMLS